MDGNRSPLDADDLRKVEWLEVGDIIIEKRARDSMQKVLSSVWQPHGRSLRVNPSLVCKQQPTRPTGVLAAGLLGLSLLLCGGCGRPAEKWNVLVLVPDTIRADHLSVNGYSRETSPRLGALARDGTNFTQAITVAPRTWQSFSSILTGLYPPHHGVRHLFHYPIAANIPTIGSVLSSHGYDTAAFDSLPFLEGMTGGLGFDEFIRTNQAAFPGTDQRILAEQVWEWISRERHAPFLAFVRFSGAHRPYLVNKFTHEFEPCQGHDHAFNFELLGLQPAGPDQGVRLKDPEAFRRLIWNVDLDERTRQHMIAHYDASVRATDEVIGNLMDRLRESELLSKTLVVVTSDHGESFGEHGYLQHGPRVDDTVMRVPLIIRLPTGHPASSLRRRVDQLVRVIDIMPTILDALGLAPPEDLDGVSLLPAIRGGKLPSLWAYGETGRSFMGLDPERYFPGIAGKHRMIRTADLKLVYVPKPGGGEYRLFDLQADPREKRNIAAERPDELAPLQQHLQTILASDAGPSEQRELSPTEVETLRALGYVE